MRIFVFAYMMSDIPDKIKVSVPLHREYWRSQSFEYYKGGPYADRGGGLITFSASNMDEAESIALKDPFVVNEVLDHYVIKEWMPE